MLINTFSESLSTAYDLRRTGSSDICDSVTVLTPIIEVTSKEKALGSSPHLTLERLNFFSLVLNDCPIHALPRLPRRILRHGLCHQVP